MLPGSAGGPGVKKEKDPGIVSVSIDRPGQQASRLQGRGGGVGWLHLMLVALPAGGCGRDKLDTRATAPEAPAATGAEAGAAQARAQVVPSAGGEGVAAAPTETQTSASKAAAAAVATGNSGGDHSYRKRGERVKTRGRREETWSVRACAPVSVG